VKRNYIRVIENCCGRGRIQVCIGTEQTCTNTHTHTSYIYSTHIYDRAQVDRWFIRKVNYRLALYGVRIRETGLTISPTSTIQNLYRLCTTATICIILYPPSKTVRDNSIREYFLCSSKKHE